MKKDFWRLLAHSLGMVLILATAMAIALAVTALLGGCKGAEKVVYHTQHDSIYVARTDTFVREVVVSNTDTLRLHDSIFLERISTIKINEAGDTIWRDRVVYRDRWHDARQSIANSAATNTAEKTDAESSKIATDTIYINKVSEKPRTLQDKAVAAGGWLAFIGLLIVGVIAFIRTSK